MNKRDVAREIAARTDFTQAQAYEAVNAFIDVVEDSLKSGGKVSLVGFGTFGVKERKARTGKHPQTGEPIEIPAKLAPFFKPGLYLKEAAR